MVPVNVPVNIPVPVFFDNVTFVLVKTFCGVLLTSCDCTVTLNGEFLVGLAGLIFVIASFVGGTDANTVTLSIEILALLPADDVPVPLCS